MVIDWWIFAVGIRIVGRDDLTVFVSVTEKKGTKMAAKWSPAKGAVRSEPFPHLRSVVRNGPEPVKGAPLLGAAKRTLDGEDRSEMIAEEGKVGAKHRRNVGRQNGTLAHRL